MRQADPTDFLVDGPGASDRVTSAHRTHVLAEGSAGKDVMNYGRLVAAALAGTVVDAVYGFLVYGMLLAGEFGRYPDVYRPNDASPVFLMCMFCGIFVAMLAAVAIYSKGIESTGGVAEGMRFGALIGVFVGVLFASISYGTLNIGRKLTAMMAVVAIPEWILVGTVIGAVYRSERVRAA
jgi:hypothetical protein